MTSIMKTLLFVYYVILCGFFERTRPGHNFQTAKLDDKFE